MEVFIEQCLLRHCPHRTVVYIIGNLKSDTILIRAAKGMCTRFLIDQWIIS